MSVKPYNPIERFNRAFILHEDLLAAAQEQIGPTMESGYPMTNMDFRDPNIVARISGAGTAAAPKEIQFDLGEEKIIEAVALADCNITLAGGVHLELGIDDGDATPPYDLSVPMFYNSRNILANGGLEDYNAFSSSDPVGGTLQANSWFVAFGSPILRVLPYQTDVDGFGTPDDAHDYLNRVYGKFDAKASSGAIAALSQWFKGQVGDVIKPSIQISTKGLALSGAHKVDVIELSAAFAVLGSQNLWNASSPNISGWEQKEGTYTITNANCRYVGLFIQCTSGYSSGDSLYIDNAQIAFQPKTGENTSLFVKPSNDGLLFKHLDHSVPARFIKLSFVNGSAFEAAPDAFCQFGRILAGQTMVLGAQRGANYPENSGDQIQLTTGGSPIETKVSGIDKRFNLGFKGFKLGEFEDMLGVLNPIQGDQIFLSMFHQSNRNRSMIGHITPPINPRESTVKNFVDIDMTFVKEGR